MYLMASLTARLSVKIILNYQFRNEISKANLNTTKEFIIVVMVATDIPFQNSLIFA